MSTDTISDAPTLRDRDQTDLDTSSLKRKASPSPSEGPDSPKRSRTDEWTKATSPDRRRRSRSADAKERKASVDEARARVAQEEKSRGRRLFGGLLGTLNQKSSTAQQQKRLEVEKKQQERLKQQRVAALEALAEKRRAVSERREREGMGWEETVLRKKHAALRQQAGVLCTRAQPPIQWRPWKYSGSQWDIIQDQKDEVEDTIRKEPQTPKPAERAATPNESPKPDAGKESPATGPPTEAAPTVAQETRETLSDFDRDQPDESGDVIMESGEDVVIY
ncbi:unnamed protein product [Parascedosporium putredinis]|uniref:Pinin/SDK/MemA protein domain-containing protein n=1 Tax=Parascedosporium putredinis TaxID=1442378 RepID=A0A9P1GWB4_9PEZI|nr:unnamed protein product [Parascedosporium putredinis]CAI7988673.1 unnamed protein product [Parascedosporium putredinis]